MLPEFEEKQVREMCRLVKIDLELFGPEALTASEIFCANKLPALLDLIRKLEGDVQNPVVCLDEEIDEELQSSAAPTWESAR